MRATLRQTPMEDVKPIIINTQQLQTMLNCGRGSAVSIGTAAGAKVQVGRRVFWVLTKVEDYLKKVSM